MRVALISIASGASARIGGRSIAQRQVDFALALGCERIICLGNGALPEAIALRHDAEDGGAKFQVTRDAHGLLGATGTADAVIVFAEGLLPESDAAYEALDHGSCILVLSAGSGVDSGFERLDLAHAWAGAMRLPGRLVERLSELPGDADPIPGLLRIARQAGLAEKPLEERVLATGQWRMVLSDQDSAEFEPGWLSHHLPPAPRFAASRQAMRWVGGRLVGRLAQFRPVYALGSAGLLVAGAVATAWYGYAAAGFGLLAIATLVGELGGVLGRLKLAGFRRTRKGLDWINITRLTADAGLVAVSYLALEGTWFERLFPGLMLVGLLLARPLDLLRNYGALMADRALIGMVLAISAALEATEPAIMLLALAVLALYFAASSAERGLTRV